MPDVTIQIDSAQQEDLEETLKSVAGGIGRANAAAINRTTTHVRAYAARKIKQHIRLPIARIKEAIGLRDRATPTKQDAVVRFNRKPVPLIDYGARDTKTTGVTVTAQLDKGMQKFAHAFVAKMPEGHTGVFQRLPGTWHTSTKGNGRGLKIEKIKELFGPSVEGTFARAPGILADTMADAGPFLAAQLASQVNRLLNRKKVVEEGGGEE